MLRIVFAHTAGDPDEAVDGVRGFSIEGPEVKDDRGQPIARHGYHVWERNGRKFFRIDVPGPLYVHLERDDKSTQRFGPFQHFSCADGIAYVDRLFFASYAETTGLWHCLHTKDDWRTVRVHSARE